MQQLIDLQHRLHEAEQSIYELEKNNVQMHKEINQLKELIKILNQRIQQPASNIADNNDPPPHY